MATLRTGRHSQQRASWPFPTLVWAVVVGVIPLNDALPSLIRTLWFVAIFGAIGMSALLMRVARPLYPVVWVFAGYASLMAVVTATDAVTISDNLFVGAQLVALIGLAPFVLAHNALADTQFAQRVSGAFLIGQTVSALVAVLQLIDGRTDIPGVTYAVTTDGRAAGLAEHPTTLGLMSCIAVLLSLRILMTGKFRFPTLVCLVANLLSLVASGSLTSAALGLGVGLVVFILCERAHLGRMVGWSIGLIVVSALALTTTDVAQYLPSLTGRYAQVVSPNEGSLDIRVRTINFAQARISEHPIVGVGLSAKARGSYDGVTTVHNAILRAWYQGGLVLGVAFAAIFVAILIVVLRSIARKEHGCEAAILAAILAYSMVSPLLEQRQLWLPLLICWVALTPGRDPASLGYPPRVSGTRLLCVQSGRRAAVRPHKH